MPTVEKVTPGRVYVRRLDREFEGGQSADVSDAEAAYLVDHRDDFTIVDDESEADGEEPADAGDVTDSDAEDEVADTEDAEGDGDADASDEDEAEGEDDSTGFNEDAWLDQDYQVRESAVLDGEVDEHLDEIEAVETSETVIQAIDERREQED